MSKNAFMVMPFADTEAGQAYTHCVKPICDEFSLNIRRADEIFTTNPVYSDIVNEIQDASLIIVDISGKNPNVFYELGIAHTLKQKQTVMITHDTFKEAPFDISHFRIIQYENSITGASELKNNLRKTIASITRDLKSIYKAQFELTIDVLTSTGKEAEVFGFLGVVNSPTPVNRFDQLMTEGHFGDRASTNHSISIERGLSSFFKMGYLSIEGEYVAPTEMGTAFAQTLMEKGFVCDQFNGHTFTPSYVSLLERMRAD
ncbi:MAG: hypothetical protein AB1717_06670 [Pseudomonadota bacterium]